MNILLQTPPRPPSTLNILLHGAPRPYSPVPRADCRYRPYRTPAEVLRRMLDMSARYFAMPLPEKTDGRQ